MRFLSTIKRPFGRFIVCASVGIMPCLERKVHRSPDFYYPRGSCRCGSNSSAPCRTDICRAHQGRSPCHPLHKHQPPFPLLRMRNFHYMDCTPFGYFLSCYSKNSTKGLAMRVPQSWVPNNSHLTPHPILVLLLCFGNRLFYSGFLGERLLYC